MYNCMFNFLVPQIRMIYFVNDYQKGQSRAGHLFVVEVMPFLKIPSFIEFWLRELFLIYII